jgi:iron donor protein CyaY
VGVNLNQPLELGLDPDLSRQGVKDTSLVGRRAVRGVGLEREPEVAVCSAIVGVKEGVRHGSNEPLQTFLVSLCFLLHARLLSGIPQQVIQALGFFFLRRLIEWLALARKDAVYGSGDSFHLLLEGGLRGHPFVYAVLPQADVTALLEFVVNHIFDQIMRGFGRVLRLESRHSTQQQRPGKGEDGSLHVPCYTQSMLDETTFRRHSDAAIEALKKSLIEQEEEGGFEVEEQNGVLNILFEEPPGKFVITPNTPPRQIWISALSTSFKLDWSETAKNFVLPKTGETLPQVVARVIQEHLQ